MPGVGVSAAATHVDLQRLRAIAHLDLSSTCEPGWGLALESEYLDRLLVRLGDPDLAERGDPADVIGPASELRLRDDLLRRGVHYVQRSSGAIGREEKSLAGVRGGRALRMTASTARGAEPGDRVDCARLGIDEIEAARAPSGDDHPVQLGREA